MAKDVLLAPTIGALCAMDSERWEAMPIPLRVRAVDRLRDCYDATFFDDVRKRVAEHGLTRWAQVGWHHRVGPEVCQCLREAIKDEDLPWTDKSPIGMDYGREYQETWDDYYVQCVEAAVGARSLQEGEGLL